MTKLFKQYLTIWGIAFVIFNLVAFISPAKDQDGFAASFVFIVLAFVGQLACGYKFCRADTPTKAFYGLSPLYISYVGLALMMLFGVVSVVIPNFPIWLSAVISLLLLGITAMIILGTFAATDNVSKKDSQVKSKTSFMNFLTAEAEQLFNKASDGNREAVERVFEALRYSDPVSAEELKSLEDKIENLFKEFKIAVGDNNENLHKIADELVSLIDERKIKCKLLK